jgi:nitrilase
MPDQRNLRLKVAAVQAAPVFLDRDATIEKACELVAAAGRQGAQLVVFPEAFVPAYPFWVWEIPPRQNRLLSDLYATLVDQAVTIPSDATERLCRAAARARTFVVMGLNERNVEASNTSLYNTLLYIDASGSVVGRHRKLVPTGGERMVWTPGDGSTFDVYDTPHGKIAGLICWENYMPLARYALYAWGLQILLAPTWDEGEPWLSTLRHIAKEGRVYVIGCSIAMRKDDIPDRFEFKQSYYAAAEDWFKKGDSAIVDPDGHFIAGPVRMKEEILFADLDLRQLQGLRWKLDVAGHYARPDVFRLTVNKAAHPMISMTDDAGESEPEPAAE